jgi:hypothetical protein
MEYPHLGHDVLSDASTFAKLIFCFLGIDTLRTLLG